MSGVLRAELDIERNVAVIYMLNRGLVVFRGTIRIILDVADVILNFALSKIL